MTIRFDKISFSIKLPETLNQLKGDDASFEMVVSNDIQPMQLFYSENIVTHSRGVIFVNDGVNRLESITDEQFEEDFAHEC